MKTSDFWFVRIKEVAEEKAKENDDDSIFDCEDRDDAADVIDKESDINECNAAPEDEESSSSKPSDDTENPKVNFRTDFFDQEAELSGSEEGESDENYDGESEDDNIVCSGDEDEMPSDEELKDQLGQIFL